MAITDRQKTRISTALDIIGDACASLRAALDNFDDCPEWEIFDTISMTMCVVDSSVRIVRNAGGVDG